MDEIEKLKKLLPHWMEHNNQHADSYRRWALKVSELGNERLAEVLERLYKKTKELNNILEEAMKSI
jgi:hypothetical protein